MPVLHKPNTVTHTPASGTAKTISKVQSASWSEQGSAIPSMGDKDIYASAVIPVGVACAVSVTSTDADCGITKLQEATALTMKFQVAQGTSATLTVLNATYLGGSVTMGPGEPSVTHAWLPRSDDGTTTPISITGA